MKELNDRGTKTAKMSQPISGKIVDLSGTEDFAENFNSDRHNKNKGSGDDTQQVIDLIPVAKEMWRFTSGNANQGLATAFAKLPLPLRITVSKTTVYVFRRRRALPEDPRECTRKARFYINLLRSHSPRLSTDPFNLVGLMCAFCSVQPDHVPGSVSFIRLSDGEEMIRLVADALFQRLKYLREKCRNVRRELGAEVLKYFNNGFDKDDTNLREFIQKWLEALKEDRKNQQSFPSTAQGIIATPSVLSVAEETSRALNRTRSHALDDKTSRYMNKGRESIQPTTNAVGDAHSHFLSVQRQGLDNQRAQYATFQQQLQDQHRQQQLVSNAMGFPSQYSGFSQLVPHQQQLLFQQNQQQQQLRQQQFTIQQRQHQQGLHQLRHVQLQQQKQKQKPKPRQRIPQMFPRNKYVPFDALEKIYDDGWEEATWLAFNPLYDSEEDDDEVDDYFNSVYDKGTGVLQNERKSNSYKMTLPPLPPPQQNMDYCLPIQSAQLALCPQGVPFLKDEDPLSSQKKGRGRLSQTASIDVKLPDVKPYDVVFPCDEFPVDLAKSLHNLKGNRRFLRMVSEDRHAFVTSSSDTERSNIVKTIIQIVTKNGGSFLKATATKRKTFRMKKSNSKEADDYTRFRLEKGFPDILNNRKIGKIFIGLTKTTSAATEQASTKNSHNATTLTDVAKSPENTAAPNLLLPQSKVYDVEHAPKIGLMNGFLQWNNNCKDSNPIVRFSDLATAPPRTIREPDATQYAKTESSPCIEHTASNVDLDEQKSESSSRDEATASGVSLTKNDLNSDERLIDSCEQQALQSQLTRELSEPEEPSEIKQGLEEGRKRDCSEFVNAGESESPPAKRQHNEDEPDDSLLTTTKVAV